MEKIVIAVDAMGGDNAPKAIVEGCVAALKEMPDVEIILFGKEEQVTPLLEGANDVKDRIKVENADDVIDMHEAPMLAIRRKTESSMVKAMLAVREKRAQAVISAGSTGAVLAGGMLRIGRIPGIERPALAPVLPGRKKPFLLIDSGANVDCQSVYLEQFGLMGSVYMEKMLGVKEPSVMLANIGAEAEKGNKLYKEAHARMSEQKAYRFDGNVEGRDIPEGVCDVVVADGFDGNLLLKYTEGLASALTGMLKDEIMGDSLAKIGYLFMKKAFKGFKNRLNYEEHGGAPLLGVDGVVVKAHGSSNAKAFASALRQTRDMVRGDVVGKIKAGLADLSKGEENNV